MDPIEKKYFELSEQLNELGMKDRKAAAAKAREIAGQVRKANNDEGYALFFEGEAFSYESNNIKAEELERKAATRLPGAAFILANYAVVLAWLDRYEESLKFSYQALEIDPKNIQALTQKGVSFAKFGWALEALKFYDQALVINPKDVSTLAEKGVSLASLGRYEEALKFLDQALAINPGFNAALRNKGAILAYTLKYQDALSYYERAREIQPWHEIDLSWLITIHEQLGNLDRAEEAARECIRISKEKGKDYLFAESRLKAIERKKKKAPAEKHLIAIGEVVAKFGKEKLDRYMDEIEKKTAEHNSFIDISAGKSRKAREAEKVGVLSVLRRWNSFTPIMTLDVQESKGGGYFLALGGQGIVIDPGFDFIRNFFQEQFKLTDVDCIFITHAHVDHMADLEALFSLLYKANKNEKEKARPGQKPLQKRVDLYMNLGAMKKLAGWVNLEAGYIGTIHVMEAGQVLSFGKVKVTATRAKHDEMLDDQYALGYVFESGGARVGFTGDTGWKEDHSLAAPFAGCDVIAAHLGSVLREEIEKDEYFYENHLGLKGVAGLLIHARPKLGVISEFGEELGRDGRTLVADGLRDSIGVGCIAGDVGTEIQISKGPKVRCMLCGCFLPPSELKPMYPERSSLIIYTCQACRDDPDRSDYEASYCRGRRWELWDQVRAKRPKQRIVSRVRS